MTPSIMKARRGYTANEKHPILEKVHCQGKGIIDTAMTLAKRQQVPISIQRIARRRGREQHFWSVTWVKVGENWTMKVDCECKFGPVELMTEN
jgi:hypothetical protein